MLSGKPLFPGRDYHHQLTLILDVLGTPTLDEFYAITTRRSRDYIRALPFRKKRPFAQIFPNANPLAVDFLTKTLVSHYWFHIISSSEISDLLRIMHKFTRCLPPFQTFDPKKRITVEEALAHPYLEAYVCSSSSKLHCTDIDWSVAFSTTLMMSPLRHLSTPNSSILIVSSARLSKCTSTHYLNPYLTQCTRTISAENSWKNSFTRKLCPSNLTLSHKRSSNIQQLDNESQSPRPVFRVSIRQAHNAPLFYSILKRPCLVFLLRTSLRRSCSSYPRRPAQVRGQGRLFFFFCSV